MDIAADPLRAAPDDEETGVFYAKVPRTDVGVLYVPHEETHTTFVVLIG